MEILPSLLVGDESVIVVGEALQEDAFVRSMAGKGILVITSKRIFFFRKNFIGTDTFHEFAFNAIKQIQNIRVGVQNVITFELGTGRATFVLFDSRVAQDIAAAARERSGLQ